jgi:hypothetical protein
VGAPRLFYNKEFSILVGGPKWILRDDPETVCVRKYLGVQGDGDFTFILYLPRWVLGFDEILHSHSHPARWVRMADYAGFRKLASIRNPIDIIHSSVFSINALASEYIQRELHIDEHQIRRELALNKLSNPAFISGLITFLKNYLDEFIPVAGEYDYVMRWEDLIRRPVEEIQQIAGAAGEPVSAEYAAQIWRELEHRNLTRYHKHSFRRGVLEDWQLNITNSHLRQCAEAGMGAYLERFGYEPIRYFDEKTYTPDQALIEEHIRRGEPYIENLDRDLITFAFNKTNFIPNAQFTFKHYPRQGAVEIEKSTLKTDGLATGFMDRIASASATVYRYLSELQRAAEEAANRDDRRLAELRACYHEIFADWLGERSTKLFAEAEKPASPMLPPILVGSAPGYNVVSYRGNHYSVPLSLGPMDLAQLDFSALPPQILVTRTYEEAMRAIAEHSPS